MQNLIDQQQISNYLARLNITRVETPSIEFLFELHKAHVEKFPWQTVDIFAGKPQPIDTNSSIQLMLNEKSGYCFHLNGAFSVLLKSLGFNVTLHRAGVQSRGKEPCIDSNHLGLAVHLDDQRWIVDVGLGDMIYEPVSLIPGAYEHGQFIYSVEDSHVKEGGWRLGHDPKGAFAGVDYDPSPVSDVIIFKNNHEHLSESPDSPWVNLLVAKNRHATGSNALTGCVFSYHDANGFHSYEINNKAEWFDILADIFGITCYDYNKQERELLWQKTVEKHIAWKNSNNGDRHSSLYRRVPVTQKLDGC